MKDPLDAGSIVANPALGGIRGQIRISGPAFTESAPRGQGLLRMADGSPSTTAIGPDLRPAFAALYQQHAGLVRRALRQLGVAPASLDDAVQDVFVVLHRRIDEYERDRSLKNWLWGIARGVASGYRRSERRRDRLHATLPAPEGPGLPERGVARREAADILDDFLGSLDADKCAVFVLSELEGRRGPEIAEQLQVNLNTVYARLRAARQRFDAAMTDHRQPDRRPLFAAWLGWAWPAWLGKPAAAVGVAAIAAVVAVGAGPMATTSVEPREAEVVAAAAEPVSEAAPKHARVSRSQAAHVAAEPVAIEPEDEVLLLDDEPELARPRTRIGAGQVETTGPLAGMQPVDDPATIEAQLATAEALEAPWSTTVEARRPVRHPSLLALRQDFIAELLRVAAQL
jgi:RNA polymerase sigma-70 factor (ECF subfamily)